MSDLLRIAIVGFGEIAHRQHVPAIAKTSGAALVAVVDPKKMPPGLPHFRDLQELLRDGPDVDAVALCTPPQVRHAQAAAALAAGKHVLLEKPPGSTVGELTPLIAAAQEANRTLFATWHSRYAPAIGPARKLLAGRTISQVTIIWKEDVRVWHPGQAWIFEAGGFGVFDPGINALSILTEILPRSVFIKSAVLDFPANREAPIAAAIGSETRSTSRAPACSAESRTARFSTSVMPEGTEMIMPGDNTKVTVELITPIAMDEGLRFAIREGGRTVGAGVVSKIIE